MTTPTPAAPTVPQYPALGSPNFGQEAYAYGSAMPSVSYRIWEIAVSAEANATDAMQSAQAAQAAQIAAKASADAASTAAGASKWQAGSYSEGQTAWSPTDHQTYRRKTTGASATDPVQDPAGWQILGPSLAQQQAAALYF